MLFTNILTVSSKKVNNKEQLMSKRDKEDYKNPARCWICDNGY